MTLLDAPKYDAARARKRRNMGIALIVVVLLGAAGAWWFWNWPEEHRVNTFLAAVESGEMTKAYGIWKDDPNWQQHSEQYKVYGFDQFQKDWGGQSDYGQIHSHTIIISKAMGNGVVMGVDINGGKKPIFLWVNKKTKEMGFSPVELYRAIWKTRTP